MSDLQLREAERVYLQDPSPENLARLDRHQGGVVKQRLVMWLLDRARWVTQWQAVLDATARRHSEARRLSDPGRCRVDQHPLRLNLTDCHRLGATRVAGVLLCRECADELQEYVMEERPDDAPEAQFIEDLETP